ncbi:hypothetical protein M408DRAFT_31243 [Serendipita vermifera MAFF 305830]|uniref:Uncharacterized protein n=1 Tax=Serendipita vermifera MAFF 305830 TaxID=933852 RepID=A0A0C2WP21_SERVB|nr:hypothetical protein M408DRAFT_31243 [Serendipita vermifera MAFF 305830]
MPGLETNLEHPHWFYVPISGIFDNSGLTLYTRRVGENRIDISIRYVEHPGVAEARCPLVEALETQPLEDAPDVMVGDSHLGERKVSKLRSGPRKFVPSHSKHMRIGWSASNPRENNTPGAPSSGAVGSAIHFSSQ